MTTTIKALPFFGGTLSGFDPSDSGITEVTSAGTYDTNYATCSLQVGPNSTGTSPTWPVASTFWCRLLFKLGTPISGFPVFNGITLLHTGTIVAQLKFSWAGGHWAVELDTLQSGSLSIVGSQFGWFPGLNFFDINVVGNSASGSAALYSNSTLTSSNATGLNHAGFAGVDQIQLQGGSNNLSPTAMYFSEVIADTTSTVGRRLRTDRLNTNSATNTGWTGSVTNINEIPTTDNSPLTAAASNLTSTFFENGLALGNITPLARGVSARMKREDASGPQHIAMVIRAGATNFPSTNIPASLGYSAAFNSWTTNPHTSANWTATNASAAENGVKSLT